MVGVGSQLCGISAQDASCMQDALNTVQTGCLVLEEFLTRTSQRTSAFLLQVRDDVIPMFKSDLAAAVLAVFAPIDAAGDWVSYLSQKVPLILEEMVGSAMNAWRSKLMHILTTRLTDLVHTWLDTLRQRLDSEATTPLVVFWRVTLEKLAIWLPMQLYKLIGGLAAKLELRVDAWVRTASTKIRRMLVSVSVALRQWNGLTRAIDEVTSLLAREVSSALSTLAQSVLPAVMSFLTHALQSGLDPLSSQHQHNLHVLVEQLQQHVCSVTKGTMPLLFETLNEHCNGAVAAIVDALQLTSQDVSHFVEDLAAVPRALACHGDELKQLVQDLVSYVSKCAQEYAPDLVGQIVSALDARLPDNVRDTNAGRLPFSFGAYVSELETSLVSATVRACTGNVLHEATEQLAHALGQQAGELLQRLGHEIVTWYANLSHWTCSCRSPAHTLY
jgi:hypothetical protein